MITKTLEAIISEKYNSSAPAMDAWAITTIADIQHILDAMKAWEANGDSLNYEVDRDLAIDAQDAAEAWALESYSDQLRAGEMPIAYARDQDGYWLAWGFAS